MRDFTISAGSLTVARGLSYGGRALTLLMIAATARAAIVANAAIAVTLADTARLVLDLGVEVWLVRAIGIASSPGRGAAIANVGLALRAAAGCIGSLAVLLIGRGVAGFGWSLAGAAALLTLTGLLSGVPVAVLQAQHRLHRLLTSLIPMLGFGLVAVALAARAGSSVAELLWMLAIFEGAATLAALVQTGTLRSGAVLPSPVDLEQGLRQCIPVAIYNALVGTYTRLDVWLLAWVSEAALATYTVAYRLYQPVALLEAAVAGVAYASMVRAGGRPLFLQRVFVRHALIRGTLAAVLLMVAFVVVGGAVITRWLPHYRPAIVVLYPLAALLPVVGFNGLCVAMLSAEGRFAALRNLAAFNLVTFAVVLAALIPRYGAVGAADGVLIGEACSLCVMVWMVRKR